MRLVFLGKLSELAPASTSDNVHPAGVRTLAELLEWIIRSWPELGKAMQAIPLRVVVNHAIVPDLSVVIDDDDEIAFLPPMSGG